MVAFYPVSEIFSEAMDSGHNNEIQDAAEEVRHRLERFLAPANRQHIQSRRLKAGVFRKHPVEILHPRMVPYPGEYLFSSDRLASLLTISDRVAAGGLRKIVLLPEYFELSGQLLSAVSPDSGLLVFYLCPVRLYLQRGERDLWHRGKYLYEELFRCIEPESEFRTFVMDTIAITLQEKQAMQRISDRYQLTHPLHRQELNSGA